MTFDYPSTYIDGDESLLHGFAQWAYSVTGGRFWTFMLIGFSVVLMIVTSRFGTARSFAFGGVVGLLGSIFLAIMGLMPWWVASIFILLGAFGIAGMILSER